MNKMAINILNTLLVDEISAAESYRQALNTSAGAELKIEFEELRTAHCRRAQMLKKRVAELGGTPKTDGNMCIFFAVNASQQQAERHALDAFEGWENDVLLSYQASLADLDEMSQSVVRNDLLPEQELSHNVVYTLLSGIQALAKIA